MRTVPAGAAPRAVRPADSAHAVRRETAMAPDVSQLQRAPGNHITRPVARHVLRALQDTQGSSGVHTRHAGSRTEKGNTVHRVPVPAVSVVRRAPRAGIQPAVQRRAVPVPQVRLQERAQRRITGREEAQADSDPKTRSREPTTGKNTRTRELLGNRARYCRRSWAPKEPKDQRR